MFKIFKGINCIAIKLKFCYYYIEARIAQLVEQWIEDPRVTSSNLVLGIFN